MTALETATDAPSRAAQRKNAANTGEKPRGRSGKKKPRADLYTEVTTKIVKELEAGRFPWAQPWAARGEAATIAADHGERLAAEGEICWAGMHSWKDMLDVLEGVGMPEALGFQADLAHTYLYTLGYNAPEHALLQEGYSDEEFWPAYEQMTDKLRPWTLDFHVAQNDGEVHGAGDHDKTGKHCPADDPNGKLDITKCSGYWLKDAADRGIKHICWDGCMFPNATLEKPDTWNTILKAMIDVRDAHGWE